MIEYMDELKYLTAKKLCVIFLLSLPVSAFVNFVERYIYNDWNFLISLLLIVCIDTALGVVKGLKTKNFSSTKFGNIILKLTLYSCALITIHILTHFTVGGAHPTLLQWTDDFAFSALIVREAISIFENIAYLNPHLLPKKLLAFLKDFDDEGNPK